jgi:hypothetical protein
MRLRVIACEVFRPEFEACMGELGHEFQATFHEVALHEKPDELRVELQRLIDGEQGKGFDAVVVGYALCSRATAGLVARDTPVVVPRAHDCITLFLGSRERYMRSFVEMPGTYYYTAGWVQYARRVDTGEVAQGTFVTASEARTRRKFEEYKDKYGEDNAKYLIEQESQWVAHYTRACYINSGIGDVEAHRQYVRDLAAERGWEYAEVEGDLWMIRRLLSGEWDDGEFVVVRPGEMVRESFDEFVIAAAPRG